MKGRWFESSREHHNNTRYQGGILEVKNITGIDLVKGAFAGVVGGLVGTVVMTQFQALLTAMTENDDKSSKKDGDEEEPATVKAASKISEVVFDHKLQKSEKEAAGQAVHYAMGAATGFVYGIATEIEPNAALGVGIPFGGAVWLVADDVVVPALGLSKPATEYPLSTHAYALSSHMIYGFATELTRRSMRKILD